MKLIVVSALCGLVLVAAAQQPKKITASASATATAIVGTLAYENNFEKVAPGPVPEEFLVLEGAFAVKEEAGNRFLELPEAPLDRFGVLFGPTETNNVAVSARIHGTGKGRRFPAMAVGLNGVGGYKLQISPGKKLLELYRGDETIGSAPYNWESGTWTMLRLQFRKVKAGEWIVEGKAWKQGDTEPSAWSVTHAETNEPAAGRASVWGAPYAGTPIRFDDLLVIRLAGP